MERTSTPAPESATDLTTNIDEALADHEVATAFHEAAVKFVDDLRLNALRFQSEHSAFIIHNAKQADIMLAEMDQRMASMKARLETALDQATAFAQATKAPAAAKDFAALFAAWEAARKARQDFDDANRPDAKGLTPAMEAFEEALSPFNDACLETALAVIKCPAPDVLSLGRKQRVFLAEEMEHCAETSSQAMAVLFADAIRFAGGVS